MYQRLLTLTLAVLLTPHIVAAEAPPNILLILSDDQAWTDYSFMGHESIRTPHLDRLAEQSAVFTRGYVPDSLCRPSLASLITGLYPHQHKITGNDPAHARQRGTPVQRSPDYLRLNAEYIQHIEAVPTVPRLLGERGYLSLQTGKWWEGHYSRGGFTHGMTHGDPARGGRHGDAGLAIGRDGLQPIYDFIQQAGDKPWFIWYAPMLPHTPHNPPARLLEKYSTPGKSLHVARYQAMCEWWDETCGELLDYLDRHGLADNTLVVYVTDNGWIQDPDSPQYAPKSKRSPYDGGLRTPIMLRWPGRIKPARYDETLVSSIDLAPTMLVAAGFTPAAPSAGEGERRGAGNARLRPLHEMPGLNLLNVCARAGRCDRDVLFGAIFEHDVPDIQRPAAGLTHQWSIQGWWKLIAPADAAQPTELYDLRSDPHETRNLSAQEQDRVAGLRRQLDAWWRPE
jgi:uncharacterized sulfatase